MAVDAYLFRDADSLVLPQKSFYPVSIPVAHYQLRHYTSCSTLDANDVLFYASGPDVYALNTATRKRTHVATLPFETRCTASGHGWLCLGGEDEGHFAAIKLEGAATSIAADVDTLLPIHFGSRRSARPQGPFLETIGGEIVNSISIHKLPGENGAEDEAVAVLTNNDKTVRVYSLSRGKEDAVLDLPFAMNHASISPDGNYMVAVGDYHQAFFFQRIKQRPSPSGKLNPRLVSTPPGWTNICVAQLHVPASLSTTGYFTTAWSPSGHLCAVGSECGYITVFDADLVKKCSYGEDAIVKVIRSTRPDTSSGPGAVRTMCFAPQPWDLLIWSEDQGIVCVSDLRTGLLTRQVLKLEPKEEALDKIEAPLTDFESAMASHLRRRSRLTADSARSLGNSRNQEVERRLAGLSDQGLLTLEDAGIYTPGYTRAARGAASSDRLDDDLSAQESRHLDALTRRNRQMQRIAAAAIPRSINYPYNEPSSSDAATRNEISSGDLPPFCIEISSATAIQTLKEHKHDKRPTRNHATVQAAFEAAAVAGSAAMSRSPAPPSSRPTGSSGQGTTLRQPDLLLEMGRLRQLARARERIRSMQNNMQVDEYGIRVGLLRRGGTGGRYNPTFGVRTAGLAMSSDGRKLFAGTEEGIFEFEIDVRSRKAWGAVQPR
ncbi:WD40-repeat-containing domain protein [Phyllosticta citriasiana]|uniref:WD40-repeat-containing domain protein n=1 Tax=Phyllosticta citriasiana TaxID=595635 RepID=A0ABR1KWG4_9PEZI